MSRAKSEDKKKKIKYSAIKTMISMVSNTMRHCIPFLGEGWGGGGVGGIHMKVVCSNLCHTPSLTGTSQAYSEKI